MDKLLVRKDVYEELLEKGFGKRDLSKLTKKKITDKNGHTRTVYVRNGEQPAEVKQPKAQEGLTPEKKARYEEMLEKVKAGSDENALFVGSKGMLNKKDAIAYLSAKLGKKPVSSASQGHLESDTPQNTDITNEDEERFGKQALSGLSGKRTSSEGTKQTPKLGLKVGDTAYTKYGERAEIVEVDGEWVTAKMNGRTEKYKENAFKGKIDKRTTQDDMKENYLDAKNEAGKDIAENNKIETLSEKIEFSPDEMKMIRDTAKEIGYRVGRDEGKLLNAINSKDKAMYSALTKKNQKVWDESGKTQKTFSQTDLLKEKIQSMNGDFGANETDSKFDEEMETTKPQINNYEDAHKYLTKLKPSSSELKNDFEDHRDIVLKRIERGQNFEDAIKTYEKEMKTSVPHMVERGIMSFEEGNNYIKAWEDLKKQI